MLHTLLSCSLSRMMIDNSFTAGPRTVKVSTRMLSYWMSQLNTIPRNTFITCYLLTLMMQNLGYIVLNQICPEKGRYNCWKCWSAVHKVCCHKFSPCRPLKTIACWQRFIRSSFKDGNFCLLFQIWKHMEQYSLLKNGSSSSLLVINNECTIGLKGHCISLN